MRVFTHDFNDRVAIAISKGPKTMPELLLEVKALWEAQFYICEEVHYESSSGALVGLVTGMVGSLDNPQYTILNNAKYYKGVRPSQLKRIRGRSEESFERLIRLKAREDPLTGTWHLFGPAWDTRGIVPHADECVEDGETDAAMSNKAKKEGGLQGQHDQSANSCRFHLKGTSFLLLFCGFIMGLLFNAFPLTKEATIRTADDPIEVIGQMDAETAERFWKRLVIDEKINLADSSALQGIAHLFAFESSRSNRTTLREYVKRMPADPPAIFFAFGDSKEELEELPAVRSLTESGHEVLLLTDPLDRQALQTIPWLEGKTLMDVRWYEHSDG
ncbi:Chaperone protein HtpG [Aphelenchoides fujianensis]|nr:Chaperone protein HtpG [Aphelenchoides fujianensis]